MKFLINIIFKDIDREIEKITTISINNNFFLFFYHLINHNFFKF